MDENMRIVEINGLKIEVDLRTAKRVDSYRVGDVVKVLKKSYGDTYQTYPGVILNFEPFEQLPTIVVGYLNASYSGAEICFEYLNAKSKDVEICPAHPEELALSKGDAISALDREIAKAERAVADAKTKREFFLHHFGAKFPDQPMAQA